jgi:hypothetical protein
MLNMDDKEKIGDLINETLSRLSSDFELDLIRLLKTVSLLTQSKEILQRNFEHLDLKSTNFQTNLGTFTISLLELENKINEKSISTVEKSPALYQDFHIYINDIKLLIKEYISYAKELNDVLKNKSRDDFNNLEVIKNLYELELRIAQTELDSRLKNLESCISETISKVSDSDSKTIKLPSNLSSLTQENQTVAAASINSKRDTLTNSQIIILSSVSIFFGFIIGIALFYLLTQKDLSSKFISSDIQNISPMSSAKKSNISKESTKEKKDVTQKVSAEASIKHNQEKYLTENDQEIRKTSKIEYQKKFLTITGPGANIRNGPGINYSVLAIAKGGEILENLHEKHGIWIKVKQYDGTEGWVSKKLVRDVEK